MKKYVKFIFSSSYNHLLVWLSEYVNYYQSERRYESWTSTSHRCQDFHYLVARQFCSRPRTVSYTAIDTNVLGTLRKITGESPDHKPVKPLLRTICATAPAGVMVLVLPVLLE